jgi:hypothetical protein
MQGHVLISNRSVERRKTVNLKGPASKTLGQEMRRLEQERTAREGDDV